DRRIGAHAVRVAQVEDREFARDPLRIRLAEKDCAEHIALGAVRPTTHLLDAVPCKAPRDIGELMTSGTNRINAVAVTLRVAVKPLALDYPALPDHVARENRSEAHPRRLHSAEL